MHDTDSITKDYMKDAATFADAFNFLLYNGEPVIQYISTLLFRNRRVEMY
mgnify:CR=1 FL=1